MVTMDYSKFYTPIKIAEALIGMLDIPNPNSIIDICCGSCNLLRAAKKRWRRANLNGVDLSPHSQNNVDFICLDGRQYAIESKFLYDLVLANPPFERLKNICEYEELYTDIFSNYSTSRLENEMLLANLRLLKREGSLLLIMPSTFLEGVTNISIRKLLGCNYSIEKIIKLPIDTFGSSLIKSYAFIIKNNCNNNCITKYYLIETVDDKLVVKEKESIVNKNIRDGRWLNENISLNKRTLMSYRGKISSCSFCLEGLPILHTSAKRVNWVPSTRYVSVNETQNIYVEDQDILISRIGKSAGCWIKYRGEMTLISDCLIVIKDKNGNVYERIKGFTVFPFVKGVATQYITIRDFENWYQTL